MAFLMDTCIFLHKLDTSDSLLSGVKCCQDVGKRLCVTDIVLDEMNQPASLGIKTSIQNGIRTRLIGFYEVKTNPKYKNEFDNIRKRYYEHLSPSVLQKKMRNGEYTKAQARELSFKDYGECSCIAIAIHNPEKYIIVSDDQGKVHLKDINLFVKYQNEFNIMVWYFNDWDKHTSYSDRAG